MNYNATTPDDELAGDSGTSGDIGETTTPEGLLSLLSETALEQDLLATRSSSVRDTIEQVDLGQEGPCLAERVPSGRHSTHRLSRSVEISRSGVSSMVPSLPIPSTTLSAESTRGHFRGFSDTTGTSSKRNIRNVSDPISFPPSCEIDRLREVLKKLGVRILAGESEEGLKKRIITHFKEYSAKEAIDRFPELSEFFPVPENLPSRRRRLEVEELYLQENRDERHLRQADEMYRTATAASENEKINTLEGLREATTDTGKLRDQDTPIIDETSGPHSRTDSQDMESNNRVLTTEELILEFERLLLDTSTSSSSSDNKSATSPTSNHASRFVRDLNDESLREFQKLFPPRLLKFESPRSLMDQYLSCIQEPADKTVAARYTDSPFKQQLLRDFMPEAVAMDYTYHSFLYVFAHRYEPTEQFATYIDNLTFTNGQTLASQYAAASDKTIKLAVLHRTLMNNHSLNTVERLMGKLELKGSLLFHTTALGNAENMLAHRVQPRHTCPEGDFGYQSFYLNTAPCTAIDWAQKRYSDNKHAAVVLVFSGPSESTYTFKRPTGDDWRVLVRNSRKGNLTAGYKGVDAIYGAQCYNPKDLEQGGVPKADKDRNQVAVLVGGDLIVNLIKDHLIAMIIFK